MAKKIIKRLKLQAVGGRATPAPPLGPALGQAGINIGEFVTKFNDATKDRQGEVVPVLVTVYEDRTFEFVTKTAPASYLILQALGKEKGSGKPNTSKVGSLPMAKIREIAEKKMSDLNANSVDEAAKIIAGTARSMGVDVK